MLASSGPTTVLRAVFERGDRSEGPRQEGPGTMITYSGEDIEFDYSLGSIHPDLLGLLCMIVFYPFVGERILFPVPVSARLKRAFSGPNFKPIRFDNIDPGLGPYSGSRMALAFGGGTDSSAVRMLFPDAYVVHEAHLRTGRLVRSEPHRVVRRMGADRGMAVTTNQRYVSEPGGWHGWPCALATALLMATDHDFGIILAGGTLEPTLLVDGTRYWDRFRDRDTNGPTGDSWQSTFGAVGIPLFSPLCGASSFLTMKLSLDLLRAGEVFSCTQGDGGACLRCPKCLRRDLNRAVVDPEHRPEWERYDHSRVHEYLEQDPLDHGHVFSFAGSRLDGLPRFLTSRTATLPRIRSQWPLRVHPGAFDFCDDRWRDMIRQRVLEHLDPMRPADVAELERWDPTRPASRGRRLMNRLRPKASRGSSTVQTVPSGHRGQNRLRPKASRTERRTWTAGIGKPRPEPPRPEERWVP